MEAGAKARSLKRLVWSPRAQWDILNIADYYDQIDPSLAIDIVDRIRSAPTPLLDFPLLGAVSTGGARKWRAARTPFIFLYDVTQDTIEVAAVSHVRSNRLR